MKPEDHLRDLIVKARRSPHRTADGRLRIEALRATINIHVTLDRPDSDLHQPRVDASAR